jgi:parallel beta-helix repeat protein
MNIFFGKESIGVKVSALIVSFVFAFSILFLAFPAKAFATTSSENDVSAEETTSNEEDASQTDSTFNSDTAVEDKQDQADNASDAKINSEDEETSQNQESNEEGQSEESADKSSVSNGNNTSNSIEGEESTDEEDITSTKETSNEDAVIDEEEQVQSDDSLNSDEDVAGESESAFEENMNDEEEVEESVDNTSISDGDSAVSSTDKEEIVSEEDASQTNDAPNSDEETTVEETQPPEVNIDILFSTDEDGYISVGEETNFGIDLEGIDIAECYWDFGDGSDSLDKNPNHTYKKDGNYTQTVTIVDSKGNTYSKTTTVHVSDHNPATTEWYVSPDAASAAEDFEDGNSSENPVSIDSVLSRIVDGDTIYFLSGTYTDTYTEDKDSNISLDTIGTGTKDNSISFVGYDGTIFDGGNTIDHAFSLTSPLSYLGFYNFTFINYLNSAIYIDNQEVTNIDIVDNTFAKNDTAIDVTMDSDLNIQNNIIVDNNVGIDVFSDNANVKHNIVVDNSQGIKVDNTRDNVSVDYNDVYNNQEDYMGTEPGENDISVDPMFTDKEALDFSLQEDSPLLGSNIIRIVQTDKEDYRYNEQVIIAGSGYSPNQELVIKILRPNGTFVEDIAVTTDINGSFVYDDYSIDYAGKNYLIKITDTDGNILEVLSFTDKTITITVDANKPTGDGNYHTIQDAVNAAISGDTISVAAGTYFENVTIDKVLSLLGPNHDISPNTDTRATEAVVNGKLNGSVFNVGANNVTISGFSITNGYKGIIGQTSGSNIIYNIIHDNLNIGGSNGAGINLWGDNDNNTIAENLIYNNDRQGIFIGYEDTSKISSGNTVSDNSIHDNGLYRNPNGPDASAYGIQLWNADNNTIQNNEVYNHDDWFPYGGDFDFAQGIYLCDSYNNIVTGNNLHDNNYGVGLYSAGREPVGSNQITSNNIAGNKGFGVKNYDTVIIDATGNWWGDASGPSGEGPGTGDAVSGNVDYSPWLGATTGTSPMTWYTNDSIQDAVNAAVSGDTITVAAGTYNEAITINKALTLLGAQADIDARGRSGSESIIDPNDPDGGVNKSWVIRVNSSNVKIDGFTVQNPTLLYGSAGLFCVEGSEANNYENLAFVNNILQNPGIQTSKSTNWGKFGYDIGYCKNVLIEYNYIKNILCDEATPWNGTAAIWPWNTDGLTVRYNKIENVTTFGVGLSNFTTNAYIYNNDISLGNPGSEAVPSIRNAGILVGPVGIDNVVIENNNISDCPGTSAQPGAGIRLQSTGSTYVKGNNITSCPIGIGITESATDISKIKVNNNSISGNFNFGLSVADGLSGGPLDATNNWWGSATGPTHSSNPGGTGDAVSGNVDYSPWLGATTGTSPPAEEEAKPEAKPWERTDIGYYKKTDTGFTTLFYSRFFRRSPDQAGLDSWVAWIESGAVTGADLVNGFIFGEECQARISDYTSEEFITFLYRVLFDRAPEDYGYNAWLDRMAAGMTREEVVDRFVHGEEFVNLCILFGIMPYEDYIGTEE